MQIKYDFDVSIYFFGLGSIFRYWKVTEPASNMIRIYFVYGGKCNIEYNGKTTNLKKNHIYLLPSNKPNILHRYHDDPINHYWANVNIYPAMIINSIIEIPFDEIKYIYLQCEAIKEKSCNVFDLYTKEEWEKMNIPAGFHQCHTGRPPAAVLTDPASDKYYKDSIITLNFLMKSLILSIMTERNPDYCFVKDDYIQKALDFIYSFYNKPINNQMIAKEVGLNSIYFLTLFKKNMGITPHNFIRQYRINMADMYLFHGIPVHQVAELVGIEPKMFCRAYRDIRGYNPSYILNKQPAVNKVKV